MITDIEVAELLKTYGDALTEAHPASLAADDFTTSAAPTGPLLTNSTTGATDPLDNIVAIAEQPRHRGRRALAPAAIVLLAGLAAFGAWTALRATESVNTTGVPDGIEATTDIPVELQPFVFPGEIILRTDPLVVIAAPSPELNFDTSDLGTEIVFGRISSVPSDEIDTLIDDALDDASSWVMGNNEFSVKKLTILWLDAGGLTALGVADGVITDPGSEDSPSMGPVGSTVRQWTTISANGSGAGADVIEDPDDPEGFRVAATVEEHLAAVSAEGRYPIYLGGSSRDLSSGNIDFSWEYEVAREVAVVQMISGDTAVWMRPIAGQVVLSGEGSRSTQIELVTYNADGEELTRRLATVEGG